MCVDLRGVAGEQHLPRYLEDHLADREARWGSDSDDDKEDEVPTTAHVLGVTHAVVKTVGSSAEVSVTSNIPISGDHCPLQGGQFQKLFQFWCSSTSTNSYVKRLSLILKVKKC